MEKTTMLALEEVITIPRHNYRTLGAIDKKELKAFAERISKEGQLTAVRIGILDKETEDQKLNVLCDENGRLLIDGERRLLAMQMAEEKENGTFAEVKVEFLPLTSYKDYLALQMTFNMDRKDTTFTEDGLGFKRFLEGGGKKADLLSAISFPEGILTKKAKLKYIDERIELTVLHPNLWPFLDNGLIRPHRSKKHQGYLILPFSGAHQRALADEYKKVMHPLTDDGILGFFNKFRTEWKEIPFNADDETLGIEEFGTGKCTGCPHLITVTEKDWDGKEEEKTYCYLSNCFEAKTERYTQRLINKLTAEKTPFVILGQPEKGYGSAPAEEEIEGGLTKIRYYKLVEPGSCSHAIAGIAEFTYATRGIPKGVILNACPAKSGCVVHHPEKEKEKQEKRKGRLEKEETGTEKKIRLATAIEWGRKLLQKGTATPIDEELLFEYTCHAFELMYRSSGTEERKTFMSLMGIEDSPFTGYGQQSFRQGLSALGLEKCWKAILLSILFHDYDRHWGLVEKWDGKANIGFSEMLAGNLEAGMAELRTSHDKRKQGWEKREAVQARQARAFYFDLPLLLGFSGWEDMVALGNILSDEKIGRKACRLAGVKLSKEEEYLSKVVANRLIGRKAELDNLFPDHAMTLTQPERDLVKYHLLLLRHPWEEICPKELKKGEDMASLFLMDCADMAVSKQNWLVVAECFSASMSGEKATFCLFHADTVSMMKKVARKEPFKGKVAFEKKAKTIVFSESD